MIEQRKEPLYKVGDYVHYVMFPVSFTNVMRIEKVRRYLNRIYYNVSFVYGGDKMRMLPEEGLIKIIYFDSDDVVVFEEVE